MTDPKPGTYDLDGQTLHVFVRRSGLHEQTWACVGYDHGAFCRRCQPVDDTLAAMLGNVIDGLMTCRQHPDTAEFEFKMTDAGNHRAAHLIRDLSEGGADV